MKSDELFEYQSWKVTLPKTDKKKLAIFDMDETLIHCLGSQRYSDKKIKKNEWGVILCPENADAVLWGKNTSGKEDWL